MEKLIEVKFTVEEMEIAVRGIKRMTKEYSRKCAESTNDADELKWLCRAQDSRAMYEALKAALEETKRLAQMEADIEEAVCEEVQAEIDAAIGEAEAIAIEE